MYKNVRIVHCIERIYDVQIGNKSTIVRVNKPMTVEDTKKLLEIDNRLDEFFDNYEIVSQRFIRPLSGDIGRGISEPQKIEETKGTKDEETKDEPRIELADIPTQKQRLWMILHDLPSDREITQFEWIKYMEEKRYNRSRIRNNASHDFTILVKKGKLKKIKKGLYKIIDKDIYKDDSDFMESMQKLKNGKTLVLG